MPKRPREVTNKPSKTPKYSHITLAEKCEILGRLEAGDKNVAIAKDYGVAHSAVSYIKKNKEQIYAQQALIKEQQGNEQKTRRTATETSALEQGIYKWYCQKISLGESISSSLLRETALLYNQKLGGPSSFKASNGWLDKFKIRHGFRDYNCHYNASSRFAKHLDWLITDGGYDLDNVYNADETGLAWKSLPRNTLAARYETEVAGRKVLKDRVTVMACGNATGTHRIPLLVIGKSQNPSCFKNVPKLPVNYRGQRSAWIDREIFTDWYTNIFLPAIKQRKSGEDEKFILVLDSAPFHPSADDLNSIDQSCKVVFLPPDLTAWIQPMNQGVIEGIKKKYKMVLLRQLLLQEEVNEGDAVTTFLKKWNMLDCCQTIAQAWEFVSKTTLLGAWRRILRKDNLMPTIHDESDVTNLVNRVPGYDNFTDTETHAWLTEDAFQPVWRIVGDDELLNLTQPGEDSVENDLNDSEEDDDTTDCESAAPEKLLNPREVLRNLNSTIQWYQGRRESEPNEFTVLFKIRELVENVILDP